LSTWFNSIQTQFRTIDGPSRSFGESEGRGDHALLLSPWPESLFDFEPTWARLAEHTHLVAIDLPGFGYSQHRDCQILTPEGSGCPSRTAATLRSNEPYGVDRTKPVAKGKELPP
jgi:pimeloyl-ACP methyl ester carboxylesterase